MKPGEVLCCIFLLAILGVDRTQILAKYSKWLRVFKLLTNRNIAITNSVYAQCMSEKQRCARSWYSNLHLGLFVCCFDVYWVS